ncbi:hypothetical protein AMTR_s00099p00153900 [Amborella trichopoda]|uniref:Uncharacterized protein n=1 Tax=Amborella trichopoda TaxID=13333 RepID=W1NWY0_AMBTC|nr:hypothetical protein AMTR_s00099p00153900 [Amborella trichopoda]
MSSTKPPHHVHSMGPPAATMPLNEGGSSGSHLQRGQEGPDNPNVDAASPGGVHPAVLARGWCHNMKQEVKHYVKTCLMCLQGKIDW